MEDNPLSNPRHHRILAGLFGASEGEAIRQLLESGMPRKLAAGEYLFRQGETDRSLLILLSGRCRALSGEGDKVRILGDIAEGEPVGELALFTGEPRSASVVALRPTLLLELKETEYHAIIARHPPLAGAITRFVIQRLRRGPFQERMSAASRNIALVNLQADLDLSPWTDAAQAEFANMQIPVRVLTSKDGKEGDRIRLFESLEANEGIHFLVCDDQDPDWSRQCLLYADLILLAADFHADSGLYPIEKTLGLYRQDVMNRKTYLLLLHPEDAPRPIRTARWFEGRTIDLHLHFRRGHAPDARRICRILTNRAYGLVLGGGGAKGFAHVGTVKAMLEAGMEIDFLGGTSAGALYGLGMVYCDFNIPLIERYTEESATSGLTTNDWALPVISIMTGKKMTRYIKRMYGDMGLEDLWISTYCISTNYSRASAKVHTQGPVWKQIVASIAVPGVFPPVVMDRELHVDGGVMDNLPIEPMYVYPVRDIIAIALTGIDTHPVSVDETPSAFALLWDRITGKRRYRFPTISSLLVNSLTLNSRQKQAIHRAAATLYVELDLRGIGLMDDSRWRDTIQKGYDQMKQLLDSLGPEDRFWRGGRRD